MKLKLVVVDLELSRRARRIAVLGAVCAAVLGGAALAGASVPHAWSDGEVLSATDLNANFAALDARLGAVEQAAPAVPAGTIVAFGGTTAPSGWILCDGRALSRTANAALFAAIGIAHGTGDGVTTFNVPDLRGRFVRGTDRGAGRDPDALGRVAAAAGGSTGDAVGSLQPQETGPHTHTGSTGPERLSGGAVGIWYDQPGQYRFTSTGGTGIAQNLAHTHAFTTDASTGSESRPVNVGVDYLIKL